ncbi:hypothetical protein V6N13_096809 [Hibiscus sabdariffa]
MGKGCSIADQELVGEEPERGVAETVITKNGNRTVKGDMENEKKGLEGSSGAKEGITHKLGSNTNQGVNLEAESTPCSGRREKEDNGVEKTSLSPIVKSLEIESEGVEDWSSASEEEGSLYRAERVFFPELDAKQVIKKRYGLLMKIQEVLILIGDSGADGDKIFSRPLLDREADQFRRLMEMRFGFCYAMIKDDAFGFNLSFWRVVSEVMRNLDFHTLGCSTFLPTPVV